MSKKIINNEVNNEVTEDMKIFMSGLSTSVVETTTTKSKTNGINGNVEPAYTATKSSVELIAKYGDKSKAIRHLWFNEKKKLSEIARLLNIRVQHVRNVVVTPVKGK